MSKQILSPGILAVRKDAENKLHRLRNTFPCGIRSADDERQEKIVKLTEFIKQINKPLIEEQARVKQIEKEFWNELSFKKRIV